VNIQEPNLIGVVGEVGIMEDCLFGNNGDRDFLGVLPSGENTLPPSFNLLMERV